MLIDHSCRLGAAIALRDVEIESSDAVLAEGTFEGGTAVQRFGCVISHISSVVFLSVQRLGHRLCDFGSESRERVYEGGRF
jgi:hypothetical protein